MCVSGLPWVVLTAQWVRGEPATSRLPVRRATTRLYYRLEGSISVKLHLGDKPTKRQKDRRNEKKQTDMSVVSVCLFVCLSPRWSLTLRWILILSDVGTRVQQVCVVVVVTVAGDDLELGGVANDLGRGYQVGAWLVRGWADQRASQFHWSTGSPWWLQCMLTALLPSQSWDDEKLVTHRHGIPTLRHTTTHSTHTHTHTLLPLDLV